MANMAAALRDNDRFPREINVPYAHPSLTATTTSKFWRCPTGFRARVIGADYLNPTGLAEDASNAFAITLQNGSTVVADGIDTDSDEAGADNSLPADTFVALTLSATDADRVLAAGDVLSVVFTEDGTATLPAGLLNVRILLVPVAA